jgi:hypothetical protein
MGVMSKAESVNFPIMFKEAFLCGVGLAVDLSGSHYLTHRPLEVVGPKRIALYWSEVGGFLKKSISSEAPKIEKEAKQMSLNLGT